MNSQWKLAALSGLCGAIAALVVVYAGSSFGLLPANGPAIHAYLMAHPEIVADMTNELQQQQDDAENLASQVAVDKLGVKSFLQSAHRLYYRPREREVDRGRAV